MNGHKNWNHWNVKLWLFNDENWHRIVVNKVRRTSNLDDAARWILESVETPCTPDGAPFTFTSIRAALRGLQNPRA